MRLIVLAGILAAGPVFALSPDDIYCGEDPKTPPVYFETVRKSCGKTVEESQGICTQVVTCVVLTAELRTKLNADKTAPFAKLDGTKKREALEGLNLTWVPTTLTCGGKTTSDGPICPAPEQCKKDIYLGSRQASISPKEFKEIYDRKIQGDAKAFNLGKDTGVAK